ncbi:MAG: aldehyde dehydrogenase family protein, partial [Herbaspirillum sp.]
MYKDVQLFINGRWTASVSGRAIPVVNPATEEVIGHVACANEQDLDVALASAQTGFAAWREVSAFERSRIMRKA